MCVRLALSFVLLFATSVSVRAGTRGLDLARAELEKYVRQVTGTVAPECRFAVDPSLDAKHDEYRIVSEGEGAAFVGANVRSVFYAVYDFLERRGGCRWFWDGDIVPKRDRIDFSGLDVREVSKFEYRAIRYFAHRGLTRFQAEHWGLEDWKREIDWCLKRRLNCLMPRISMDDTWQKAFPDIVPYPDPAKPLPEAGKGYNNRSLFWSLEYRGRLRKAFTQYAFARGLMIPTDFGTMTHWYSRTPKAYLEKKNPPFLPLSNNQYGEPTGRVFDVFEGDWLDEYWKLTDAFVGSGYGSFDLLHTIGLGERLCFRDRAKNLKMKVDVLDLQLKKAAEKAPNAPILLAGWDFYMAWTPAEVRKLLPRLDPKRVLIWDYAADAMDGWDFENESRMGNFTDWDVIGKFPYTFGIFLTYEQGLDVRANYALIEARQRLAEDDPMCKGYILWPESSHTDTFLLRYFTANAWRGGKTSAALLDEFCRDRYGKQSSLMKKVWERVIPLSSLYGWYGNYGVRLTQNLLWPAPYPLLEKRVNEMVRGMEGSEEVFRLLAEVDWTDPFVRRDVIDLARTTLDRLAETRRMTLVQAYHDWCLEGPSDATLLSIADDYVRLVRALSRLLALHTDFSMADSYDRLNAIEPIVNPDFEHVLVDNALNTYCRSHQAEAAKHWYEPLAEELVRTVREKAGTHDRTMPDRKTLESFSERLHSQMLARPLSEMRPTAPRTQEAFRALMGELTN